MQGHFGYPQKSVDQRRVLSSSFTRNLQFRVTTILGAVEEGYVESPTALSTRFNGPRGLDIFKNNTLFIADTGNHSFRTHSLGGGTTKLSGRVFQGIPQLGDTVGNADNSSYNRPQSLVLSRGGTLIVLDTENHCIKAINPEGTSLLLAGNGIEGDTNGEGSNARLRSPIGMCLLANGDILFCDTGNHKIKKLDLGNNVSTVAGSAVGFSNNVNPLFAQFNQPYGVVVDADQNIYVSDRNNNAIRKISPTEGVTTFAGGSLGDVDSIGLEAKLNQPTGISTGFRNELYFIDSGNNRVKRIASSGSVATLFGYDSAKFGENILNKLFFDLPRGIAVSTSGDIYIADGNQIKKLAILP